MASAQLSKSAHHRRDILSWSSESYRTPDNDQERDGSSTRSPRCLESINEDLLKRRLKGTLFSPGEHRSSAIARSPSRVERWCARSR
jgi:hypothetical protein